MILENVNNNVGELVGNIEMEPDIKNMTISEYLEYEAAKKGDYGMMFDPEEVQHIIMRRMLTLFTGIRSNDVDIENITIAEYNLYVAKQSLGMNSLGYYCRDVERIRKFFNVPDEIDKIVQPLILKPIHITPPNDDYVAPATKSILDKLLDEFRDEILNVTMVDDEADFNPTKDLEELERLLAKEPQSNFTKIQVDKDIISLERGITARRQISRSPRLVLCGNVATVAAITS
ncbi:hypothetical protein Tco_1335679 [Tanacetum coccineum]